MRKVVWSIKVCPSKEEGEFEVPDDATEYEIEEMVRD